MIHFNNSRNVKNKSSLITKYSNLQTTMRQLSLSTKIKFDNWRKRFRKRISKFISMNKLRFVRIVLSQLKENQKFLKISFVMQIIFYPPLLSLIMQKL